MEYKVGQVLVRHDYSIHKSLYYITKVANSNIHFDKVSPDGETNRIFLTVGYVVLNLREAYDVIAKLEVEDWLGE